MSLNERAKAEQPAETSIAEIHRLLDLAGVPRVIAGERRNAYDRVDSLLSWRGARKRQEEAELAREEAWRLRAAAQSPCAMPGCTKNPALKPGCFCILHQREARRQGLVERGPVTPPSEELKRQLQEGMEAASKDANRR